jgi:membrane protease YdiL (CAAX protease family)
VGTTKEHLEEENQRFRLFEHPWLALVVLIVTTVFSIFLAGGLIFGLLGLPDESPRSQFIQGVTHHVINLFLIAPFVLRLPNGKTSFRKYLDDIRLTNLKPLGKLLLLALSCYLILALSQSASSFVYRLFEGKPITISFIKQVFDLSGDLPPKSSSLLVSIPSIFEEVAFRGIILTVFLRKYSERKSIIFSSLGFGLIHILNLAMGRELVWVLGQLVWAFLIGLFYGYVFVITKSLLPSMIIHYLGNAFIGSLTWYMQVRATIEIQAVYGIIFSLGIVPVALMIPWTRFFVSRWITTDGQDLQNEPNMA